MKNACLAVGLLFAAGVCFAADVTGRVMDATTAVIIRAEVVLVSQAGVKLSVRTDETGTYHFAEVTPGDYTIEAVAYGFKRSSDPVAVRPAGLVHDIVLQVADIGGDEVVPQYMAWVSAMLLVNGSPLANGRICFSGECATADGNGRYSIAVTPGFVTVHIYEGNQLVSEWKTFLPYGTYNDQAALLGDYIPSIEQLLQASDVSRFTLPPPREPKVRHRRGLIYFKN